MEGSNLLRLPRTLLKCTVELRVGDRKVVLKNAVGNVSVSGIFLESEPLPLGAPVHLKIGTDPPFVLDGVIRNSHLAGIGIEFTAISASGRKGLDKLIAELAPREILAA
jgi:PilZ domain